LRRGRAVVAIGHRDRLRHAWLWDLSHCLAGASLAGLSMTDIPLGYGIFCSSFDFTVAAYLMLSGSAWQKPGKLDLTFWRQGL